MENPYLRKQPEFLRYLSVVAMAFAALFFLGFLMVILLLPFFRPVANWWAYTALALIAILFAFGTSRFYVMLDRNQVSRNGITLVPGWCVSVLGLLCCVSLLFVAYLNGSWIMALEAMGLFVTFLAIGKALNRNREQVKAPAEE